MYTENDIRLYHHGILGQKWGTRNGPPYPLKAGQHSSSEKKIGWRKSLGGKSNEDLYYRKRKSKQGNIGSKRVGKQKGEVSEDYLRAHQKKPVSEMSDKELQDTLKRLDMERRYEQSKPTVINKGRSIAQKYVKDVALVTATAIATKKIVETAMKAKNLGGERNGSVHGGYRTTTKRFKAERASEEAKDAKRYASKYVDRMNEKADKRNRQYEEAKSQQGIKGAINRYRFNKSRADRAKEEAEDAKKMANKYTKAMDKKAEKRQQQYLEAKRKDDAKQLQKELNKLEKRKAVLENDNKEFGISSSKYRENNKQIKQIKQEIDSLTKDAKRKKSALKGG